MTLFTRVMAAAGLLFLPLPIVVVVISSFSRTGYLQFPPKGLSLRWFENFMMDPDWTRAMLASAVLALLSATIITVFAFMAAWARVRGGIRGGWFDLVMLSPLFIPHAAVALGLWSLLVPVKMLGSWPGIFLAHAILAFPFAYRPLLNAMRGMDLACEEAAASLGARPAEVFARVTLPLLRPGIAAAFLFAFIISFDEVSVTMFLVGPHVTTLPVRIFTEIQENGSPVVAAVSTFLVVMTVILFWIVDRLIGVQLFVSGRVPDKEAAA